MVTTNPFSSMFGRSPFKALHTHIIKTDDCAKHLLTFFDACEQGDWDQAASIRQTISKLEREADELKTQLRLNLPNSLFLPVSRSDLLELIHVQDSIANVTKDIAGIMLGRRMQIPETLVPAMRIYLKTAVESVCQARRALGELEDLVESGFGRNMSVLVEKLINELHELEKQSDEQQIEIRQTLFSLEASLPPVDVIFLYKIIDWIGDVSDQAEKVGTRLQILMAR